MKLVNAGLFGLLLVAGCGGGTDDGGRNGEGIMNDDVADDDEGSSDDDGDADDDGAPAEDDDGAPAGDDDESPAGDDDGAPAGDDDATAEDDDATGPIAVDDVPAPDDDGDDDSMLVDPADDDAVDPITPGPVPTTPITPDPVDPGPAEDCVLVGQSQGQGFCDVREQCSNAYKYSSCSQLTDGTWQCSCSDGSTYKNLEVNSAEAPCGTVTELCGDIPTPEFTSAETCELELQSASVDYCQTQTRCTIAEPYNEQISVVQTRYKTAYCSSYNGTMSCSCSGDEGSLNFTPEGVDIAEACALGTNICDSLATLEPTGERTCTPSYNYAGTNYCQLQQNCTQTVTVDGQTAQVAESEQGYCSQDTTGLTQCSCYNNSRSYSFSLATDTVTQATCETAMGLCAVDTPPVTEGPVECTVSSQSASSTYCSANVTCSQDATIGDTAVGLFGSLYAYCSEIDGGWSCQCQSNTTTVPVEVTSTDSWDACSEAVAQCPDVLDPGIGGGSSGGGGCMTFASEDSAGAAVAIPCAL